MLSLGFRTSLYLLATIAGFGLFLATAGGLWQVNFAANAASRIYEERTAPTIELMKAVDALHRARQTILMAISEEREEAAQAHLGKLADLDAAMKAALQASAAAVPDQKNTLANLESLIGDYNKARDQSVKMIEVGDLPSALGNIKINAGPKFDKVLLALSEAMQNQARLARQDYEDTSSSLKVRSATQIVLALLTLIAIGVLFVWIVRSILRQLGGEPKVAAEALSAVANGQLNVHIGTVPAGSLLADLKAMAASLAVMVREIQNLSVDIDQRSQRTFRHMQEAAQRGATQADSATEVAAGVEELATSIESVSEHATATGQSALTALERAQSGHTSILILVDSMHTLSQAADQSGLTIQSLVESSNSIMNFVVQINEIADQTNLLALNAAIEAARAGEQGRGFAVVADEVRKLAEKTGSATHQIRDLLENVRQTAATASGQMSVSHERIQVGTRQVAEVTQSIGEIEQQLAAIAATAKDTSDALHEQRTTSQAIARNMEKIASAANENSAAAVNVVGEAASVIQAADALHQRVGRFTLPS
jgi:methyl-accepting chemotaxis protein